MEKGAYMTIPQLAKILGVSRIAVYRKVKKGEIRAIKIGRTYAIPKSTISAILGETLSGPTKKQIEKAVLKTVQDYGEVLRLLGRE
jgi:excisionase family DNA binding protein